MIFKATNLIAEAFEREQLKFRVEDLGAISVVEAGFVVPAGPQVVVRFISRDDDNDVAVRVYGLVNEVPNEKRSGVLEVCNNLNAKIRYYKFYLDPEDGNVNLEADLPVRVDDSCVGECCVEMFLRSVKILKDQFHLFTEALCGVKGAEERNLEILRALQELGERPIVVKDNSV